MPEFWLTPTMITAITIGLPIVGALLGIVATNVFTQRRERAKPALEHKSKVIIEIKMMAGFIVKQIKWYLSWRIF